jgi:hypothetical protein
MAGFPATSDTGYASSPCKFRPSKLLRSILGDRLLPLSCNKDIGPRALEVYNMSSLIEMSSRTVSLLVSINDVRILLNRETPDYY